MNKHIQQKVKYQYMVNTVERWSARNGEDKEIFCILENVSIVPNIKPLKEIKRENKIYKIFDGVRLTKIHSLESILIYFISEKEINTLNEEEMREKIKKELELMHHILPNRIG